MEDLTVIFFSCRRLHLLEQSVRVFLEFNKYPYVDFIIVNDSGDSEIWNQIENTYQGATFVFNKENVGLIKSIDLGYEQIKTDWIAHFEDDWCVKKGGFIEPAMEIMKGCANIEEVWFADYNNHPLDNEVLKCGNTSYKLASENHQKGLNGFNDFAWHGFTTACALKRKSDYLKVAPYSEIPWRGTIWHREQAIGERYHELGYRTACLLEDYVYNIGYGQSEYKSGMEK